MSTLRLVDATECERLRQQLLAVYADGEEAEQLLRAAIGAGGEPVRPAGSAVDAWRRLKDLAVRRQPVPREPGKLQRAVRPFTAGLATLPITVEIARVGSCSPVGASTRERATTWHDRLAEPRETTAVAHEVTSALADLTAARLRLELGVLRLA